MNINGIYSQRLLFVDGYLPYIDAGISVKPNININSTTIYMGVMGGVKIQHSSKRIGLNLRVEYYFPVGFGSDTSKRKDVNMINSYFEFTYRFKFMKNRPLMLGLGLAKPTFANSPYMNCPVNCFASNLTISLQQKITFFNIEVRMYTPFGTWKTGVRSDLFRYVFFSVGVNYSFSLSKKNEK